MCLCTVGLYCVACKTKRKRGRCCGCEGKYLGRGWFAWEDWLILYFPHQPSQDVIWQCTKDAVIMKKREIADAGIRSKKYIKSGSNLGQIWVKQHTWRQSIDQRFRYWVATTSTGVASPLEIFQQFIFCIYFSFPVTFKSGNLSYWPPILLRYQQRIPWGHIPASKASFEFHNYSCSQFTSGLKSWKHLLYSNSLHCHYQVLGRIIHLPFQVCMSRSRDWKQFECLPYKAITGEKNARTSNMGGIPWRHRREGICLWLWPLKTCKSNWQTLQLPTYF